MCADAHFRSSRSSDVDNLEELYFTHAKFMALGQSSFTEISADAEQHIFCLAVVSHLALLCMEKQTLGESNIALFSRGALCHCTLP